VVREAAAGREWLRRLGDLATAAAPRVAVVVLVLAVLAGGLWLGTRWGSSGDRPTGPAAATTRAAPSGLPSAPDRPPPSRSPDWRALLDGLYRQRAEAFTTTDAALLHDVYTADSPLRVRDETAIDDLVSAGEVLRGFAPAVVEVTAAAPTDDEVRLELTDRWPGYDVVPAANADGPPVQTVPERGAARVRMVLVRTPAGWRISTAERVG
jgi:hypothetical protein